MSIVQRNYDILGDHTSAGKFVIVAEQCNGIEPLRTTVLQGCYCTANILLQENSLGTTEAGPKAP